MSSDDLADDVAFAEAFTLVHGRGKKAKSAAPQVASAEPSEVKYQGRKTAREQQKYQKVLDATLRRHEKTKEIVDSGMRALNSAKKNASSSTPPVEAESELPKLSPEVIADAVKLSSEGKWEQAADAWNTIIKLMPADDLSKAGAARVYLANAFVVRMHYSQEGQD